MTRRVPKIPSCPGCGGGSASKNKTEETAVKPTPKFVFRGRSLGFLNAQPTRK